MRHESSAAPRREYALLVLILLVGAALRFTHLGAGVPYALGADEPHVMNRVVHMMKTGDFNPHFFDWPSLTFYLHLVVACLTVLAGAMRGEWGRLDQVDPAALYLAGRMLTAAIGTATIALVYFAGRRWGRGEAVVAAGIMAIIPYHVRESHYVLTDVPAAFFVSLAFVLALRARELGTLSSFALSGVAAGLAAGTKYNGLIVIVLPLLVSLVERASLEVRVRRTLAVGAAAVAAFLASTPYALLDLPKFLADYVRLAAIFANERAGEPGWQIYLKHLRIALGWPALLLSLGGLVLALTRAVTGPDRLRWLLLPVFSLLYFKVMAGSYQIYGRYLLPLFPFISVLIAIAVISASGLVRRRASARLRPLVPVLLVLLAVAAPVWSSIAFVRRLGQPSTVDLAYRWIEQHVPPGSRLVIEQDALTLPHLRYQEVLADSLITRSYDEYLADGVDYLLASSEGYGAAFAGAAPAAYVAYQTLFTRAQELATFRPSADVPGPELRVFRLQRD